MYGWCSGSLQCSPARCVSILATPSAARPPARSPTLCVIVCSYTGEMGVIAVVPLVAFFGFDVLNKDDFNSFLWNVVMLAMGGLSLGEH